MARGLTEEAFAAGAVFQRQSVKKVQKDRLNDYIQKLEEDVFTLSAQASEMALDKEDTAMIA